MAELKFNFDWAAAGHDVPELANTMAELALHVGNVNLTRNDNIWAKSVRDSVLVSAYPLAMWLASSWWRLNFEPLPAHGKPPSVDWRMAHEIGAANHGFVWPKAVFASDSEVIQIWAEPSCATIQQSVKYLNKLDAHASVKLADFQRSVTGFVESVISRLEAVNCKNSHLYNLWQLIQEEIADPQSADYRKLEAELGYDPDECPDAIMAHAQKLEQRMGAEALTELAPVYGRTAGTEPLKAIDEIIEGPGLTGKPEMPQLAESESSTGLPWQRAIAAARKLRQCLSNEEAAIDNKQLYGLLGLTEDNVEGWVPLTRSSATVAIPTNGEHFKFVPRKKHPQAKRFELARLLGDFVLTSNANHHWLTSTDLSTSRQKYQRAFAAEFLCPIDALKGFLDGDYSESAIEEAAEHFRVSQATVDSLLKNNGLVYSMLAGYTDTALPYRLGA